MAVNVLCAFMLLGAVIQPAQGAAVIPENEMAANDKLILHIDRLAGSLDTLTAHVDKLAAKETLNSRTDTVSSEEKFVAFRNASNGRVMCGEVDSQVLTWSSTVQSQLECSSSCDANSSCQSFNYKDSSNETQPQSVCEMFAGLPSNFFYQDNCTAYRKVVVPAALCPAPFKYDSSANGCYFVVTELMEWSEVASMCSQKALLAHALVVEDAVETLAIQNLFQTSNMTGCSTRAWTAGQKLEHGSSVWQWKTDMYVANVTYTAWGPTQPDNINGYEDCIEIIASSDNKWNDVMCNRKECVICEVDMD